MSDSLTPEQIAAAQLRASKDAYLHRALVGLDQFLATLLDVENDQTISSATAIAAHKESWYQAFAVGLNNALDLLQKNHGELAQAGDIERAKEVIATDTGALAQGQ